MKKYPHIISKLFYEPLIITKARHHALCQVVESHMAKVEAADGAETGPDNTPEYIATDNTAIIPVTGVIVGHASDIPMSSCGCGCDDVANMINVAVADPSVTRIIFNFNSPGGSVTGVPELGRKIAEIPKKTLAFTDSECCSGALWLAMQCQEFAATESAQIGSIGVWCAYLDLSKSLKKAGENIQAFSAGKYKTMGAYWKPLTDEEKTMIQSNVDKIFKQFQAAVQTHRSVGDDFMQGQVFDGEEAVAAGIVDAGLVNELADLI